MSIKLVVFDMAGTTVADDHKVTGAFKASLQQYNYEVPSPVIDLHMGYEKTHAIRLMLDRYEPNKDNITDQLVSNIHTAFVNGMIHYYRTANDITALPNVEDTFAALHNKGIKIGINTGFSRDIAQTIIDRLHWQEKGLIDYLCGSDEVELGRPYPFMIHKFMHQAGITDPSEVAKVGDTEVDMHEGQNAGCKYVIGVTTGSYSRQELEAYHPDHIIDDIAQVIDIISQKD
ncbi:HAD-IA family hydrolase [Mucilaginibacter sp. HMF5004]|uniref:HAD-IA family hydrolase n=1 Tax=Mucilaginibacter rivuli TaxID=2857527 RepID=UPI001C5D8036|nr:HAD-IA family hydrolase [Mucilaginibacter rivuli]MBW4888525.1 HAD-IA family hydrolase [Mucilaginibacter rivuli]